MFDCPLYKEIRSEVFQYAHIVNCHFNFLTKLDKGLGAL